MDAERIEKLRTTYMLGCRTDELGIEVFDALRSLRSQLATLSVGKAWVPEPTKVERTTELLMAYPVSADWGTGFDQGVAWARAHAVAVAPQASCTTCSGAHCCSVVGDPPGCTQGEGVLSWTPWTMGEIQKYVDAAARQAVLPELTREDWVAISDFESRHDYSAKTEDLIAFAFDRIRSRIRTIGPDQVLPTWIPCEERLPKDGQSVAFISRCERDSHYHGRVLGGRYIAGEFGGFTTPGLMTDASHWFPMPAIPDALRKAAPEGVA